MKRILLFLLVMITVATVNGQTTYYWVGGAATTPNISLGANWKTNLDGTGSSRATSTTATDILVFDGTNVGGATPLTGPITVNVNTNITCAQIKFVNNAQIRFIRGSEGGTSTVTLSGDGTGSEDFLIEVGSSLSIIPASTGSLRLAMAASNTGRVSGSLSMIINTLTARIDNTTSGTAGSFRFTSGSSFTTNISGSSSYAFGSSSQSTEKWVSFEAGSHLYYEGGNSPAGSGSLFSAIDMQPGSIWHQRATNTGGGNFFNSKSYGDIVVENNANLIASGPIYRIGNLTINTGSTFTTHSSGQTVVLGDLVVNGNLSSDAASNNELVLVGNSLQTVSGNGAINVASLIVPDNANVILNKSISVDKSTKIYGKLDLADNQITGNGSFAANAKQDPLTATANLVAGSYTISGTGIAVGSKGLTISGPGVAPNTSVVATATDDMVYLSKPLLTSGTAVTLSLTSNGAVLATAHTNGFDPVAGSVVSAGDKSYEDGISYIINGATNWPFGESTGSSNISINAGSVEINAPVTVNKSLTIIDQIAINGKLTLRPSDILHIGIGAVVNGSFGPSNYIATSYDVATGTQSMVQYDGISATTLIPIGTIDYYLPATLTPLSAGDFTASVFQGITANGTVAGAPLTALQKLKFVDAVWNINRLTGSGNSDLTLQWDEALEGTTFSTLTNAQIGLVQNTGSSYTNPIGIADNVTNTATATVGTYGAFSASAVPQTEPFLFNDLPAKTYGDPDFNGGASSLNFVEPVVYTSINTDVAIIVNGNIHITGAGTTDITASQAANGVYPAVSLVKSLTVDKAPLKITADSKIRFEATANPPLTITYDGFVLVETDAVFLTAPIIATSAVLTSPPGDYPITVSGATAANYTISFVNGVMTVKPKQTQAIIFDTIAVKTYGNADFAIGAGSNNTTIPVIVSSSNTNIASITGNNIHIVGAGTATITASQAATDGYFAATDVVRILTVKKAPLTIRVRDTTRLQGQENPQFTITYTGFVLGQTPSSLLSSATATTTAGINFPGGYYPITLSGGTSNNYAVTYTNGKLTVMPADGGTAQYMQAFMSNSSTLTIRVFSLKPGLADITLYDIAGRPLIKKNIFMPVGFINSDLPIGKFPAGIYNVTIKGNGVDLKKTVSVIK